MKKLKKITTLILLSIVCSTALTGCRALKSKPIKGETNISYQKMKKQNKRTYPLVYFENVANTFKGSPSYVIGYRKENGVVVKKTLNADSENYKEIVDPDLDVPYVVIDGIDYYIHRPPYYIFNQEKVEGEVSEKE
ncbi:hypothetical protein [Ligilactobacillus murinus]|uniref:Uncharacterized protein n=1 Tax=Ligilactobacillus murinus TaxID=1622 RepID=A0AAE6WHV7_9LACO|nr:hypothetical protein [Ligilactobacillus murinus]NEF82865.1 hypothetical protein [Ligilactobacillus murinus]NEF84332.1 hypothetical protein [Ligilactobacillus murinus]NEF87463.1 hypothetical protein [Ligilactobacillus murinus]NEF89739.1 hypothetical protein [Ligilactobacillus murinus]NEF92020.1 hypothetical protein [Ligilactobacillus murinus]